MSLNEVESKNKVTRKDGGYGWIVVLGAFFIQFFSAGIAYTFGILYIHFLDEFGESKAYTSWILSLNTGVGSLAGPIASFFIKRFGCRAVEIGGAILSAVCFFASSFATNVFMLIVTIGIGGGFSFALTIIPSIIAVTTYFDKRRSLATGLAVSGAGTGIFLLSAFVSFLADEYSWRTTLKILSGCMLSCALFGISFRPINLPAQENSTPENADSSSKKQSINNYHVEQTKKSHSKSNAMNVINKIMSAMNLDLFKNPVFVLFCVSSFMTCLGYYVPFFYLTDRALTLDIPKEKASQLISIIGIANTLGRLFLGYISDKPFLNRLWVYCIALIICGTATASSFLCRDYISLMVYAMVFGFTCASLMTLNSVILADFHGLERIETAFGMGLFFRGIATFISGPIVGYLHDITHSYTPGFLFGGIMLALSGAILFAMPPLQRRVVRRQTQHKNEHIETNDAS